MIKPTIGRVLWYWADPNAMSKPYAAIVCQVWSDHVVNLAYFDESGVAANAQMVTLYHGGGERPNFPFCEWMPYQLGQAKKAEAAEAKIKREKA